MSDVIHEHWLEHNNNKYFWNCSMTNVDGLAHCVTAIVKEIYQALGPGLPGCVYQLKIYNALTKKGFQLQTEKSILDHCVVDEPVRSLVVVNGMLVMEYITTDKITDSDHKRIKFDLQNNNYMRGLLIHIPPGGDTVRVQQEQCYTYH